MATDRNGDRLTVGALRGCLEGLSDDVVVAFAHRSSRSDGDLLARGYPICQVERALWERRTTSAGYAWAADSDRGDLADGDDLSPALLLWGAE